MADTDRGKFMRTESMANNTDRLITMLDLIEKRVEALREQAQAMEQEKDTLVSLLQQFNLQVDESSVSTGEREEITITADRLLCRCLTVDISVMTVRNQEQEAALGKTNKMLEELSQKVKNDTNGSKELVESYLNACLTEASGAVDRKFQAAIIECTADDQKKVRKHLREFLNFLESTESKVKDYKLTVE
ncbi:BAG family molecular chaperone regulator 2-like [Ptychodera flava]|uniref:BAG family molecular chaperone regulator 2-like n=1 Tax=Ptychodera flava TaxID=63121 RepID=UPI00396A6C5A